MNIAIVPARGGSKSIPFKNIKLFCGQPLIYWCLLALQNAKRIDVVYVATDCDDIEGVVAGFGLSKINVFRRSKENARDESSTESVMLELIEKVNLKDEDLLVLVQATSPLIQASDIESSLERLFEESADSLLTCTRSKKFFWSDDAKPINYNPEFRPRRQDFSGSFEENGALYASKVVDVKKYKSRIGGKVVIYEMSDYTSVELDDDVDWVVAERLMEKYILSPTVRREVKLFLSDVDGTMTDAGMYYGKDGREYKKFNTRDGKGFELLRTAGIKTGIITTENTEIVRLRAEKIKADYLFQGMECDDKLAVALEICSREGIDIAEVAYIGDDINCRQLLKNVGVAACPADALQEVKDIPQIIVTSKRGGDGAVREFADMILAGSIELQPPAIAESND